MCYRLVVAIFLVSFAASAQRMSVQQLTRFLSSSVRMKQADKEVSSYLLKARLTDRLDDHTVEELQALGIGPKTLAALRVLRDQSQGLGATPPVSLEPTPRPIPAPLAGEQESMIRELRQYASNYSKSLPDFICTQVTRRYLAATPGRRHESPTEIDPSWQLQDTLTVRLSYFEQKEEYKLVLVDDTIAQQDYRKLSGVTSTGEFGSMLKEIFDSQTESRFEWDHWATLRGHRALTFGYHVLQAHSRWGIDYQRELQYLPAYSGLIYVDRDTHAILRITLAAEDMPPSFPIAEAETVLDYDYQTLSDHTFLLPLKAENRMRTSAVLTRNDVEFRLYRKFSSESEIKYETPDPLTEDQTKEQPPK